MQFVTRDAAVLSARRLSQGLAAAGAGFGAQKGRGAAPAPNQLSVVSIDLGFFLMASSEQKFVVALCAMRKDLGRQ